MTEIESLYDRAAKDYDRARRQLVPCFDDFYGTVLDLVPYERGTEIRVLDLGAGTGLLSALIAGAYPQARITLVDVSERMLGVARDRFASEQEHFGFLVADYARDFPGGRYELVVSALSVHHLEDADKRVLFGNVYEALVDGGLFVNADQVLGPTPEIEKAYRQSWLRRVRERGVAEDDLASALARMEEDKMSTLDAQLGWLKGIGFQAVDCWYKNHSFAVYSGRRRP
jgi:tRNA (cmo5U34)-methyltransferase